MSGENLCTFPSDCTVVVLSPEALVSHVHDELLMSPGAFQSVVGIV